MAKHVYELVKFQIHEYKQDFNDFLLLTGDAQVCFEQSILGKMKSLAFGEKQNLQF